VPLSVSVRAATEPSRLVTYDNATIGEAAVRQLHKRARRGRPPARRGLSRYLPTILLFALSLLSLAAPVAAVSRRQFRSAVAVVVVVVTSFCIESNRILSAARCIVRSLFCMIKKSLADDVPSSVKKTVICMWFGQMYFRLF